MNTSPRENTEWSPNIALRLDCLRLAAEEGLVGAAAVARARELEAFLKEAV